MLVNGLSCLAGLAVAMSLLQPDAGLTAKAVQLLKAKSTDSLVQPDLLLLSLLLDRGLLEDVNGALQAGLARALVSSPNPQSFPADTKILSTSTVLLPTMVAHFAQQGCYAQAAEMCAHHTALHPAYFSLSAGLQRLQPYLSALRQHEQAVLDVCSCTGQWPLPNTLLRLSHMLSANAELALKQMSQDKVAELL